MLADDVFVCAQEQEHIREDFPRIKEPSEEEFPEKSVKSKTPKKAKRHFWIDYLSSISYDDNAYRYSSDSIENYNDYQERDTRFKHVKSISDFVSKVGIEGVYKNKFFNDLNTYLGAGAGFSFYWQNTVKNWQAYHVFVRQQIDKMNSLELRYSFIPEYLTKYLKDLDIPSSEYDRFRKATYRSNALDVIYRLTPQNDLGYRFRYRLDYNDYNGDFNEYDAWENSFRNDVTKKWCDNKVETGVFHEFNISDARADDDDPAIDKDASYNQNRVGCHITVPVYKEIKLRTGYSFAYRKYTSDLDMSDDPLHRDRVDYIQEATALLTMPIHKDIYLFFEYMYQYRDAHLKCGPADIETEPYVGYRRNVASIGISGRF